MPVAFPIFESANENGGVSMNLRKPGANTGSRTVTELPPLVGLLVAMLR